MIVTMYTNAKYSQFKPNGNITIHIVILGYSDTIAYECGYEFPHVILKTGDFVNTRRKLHKGLSFQFYELRGYENEWACFHAANDAIIKLDLDKS